ncbi:hypothetical protein PLANPX_2139 [Lacipirellula parvula]|uniref:Uncharacterized protein n=1 Tax=Lacipirellula parvula TaxID=2650471 RepID=A0A5K7X9G0_9BACT|nr:hypothetical protein PLANPX_2139 [Lacipirellula parvula]
MPPILRSLRRGRHYCRAAAAHRLSGDDEIPKASGFSPGIGNTGED